MIEVISQKSSKNAIFETIYAFKAIFGIGLPSL